MKTENDEMFHRRDCAETRLMSRRLAVLLAVWCVCGAAFAAEWECRPEIVDGMTGPQQITNALTSLSGGDTILVKPGTYDFTGISMYTDVKESDGKTYSITNHLRRDINFTIKGDTSGHWDDAVVFTGNGRFCDASFGKTCNFRNITFDGFDCQRYPSGSSYESRGGALRLGDRSTKQTVSNCVFRNCSAYIAGAVNGGRLVDCLCTNNYASSYGGVGSATRFEKCRVVFNRAGSGGYGVAQAHYGCSDTYFEGNSTPGVVGTIKIGDRADSIVSNCTFVANSANYGGALGSGSSTCIDCVFVGNVSTNDGGAVRVKLGENIPLFVRCAFTNNFAKGYGGAVYNARCTNCVFSGNMAIMRGGAVSDCDAVDCVFRDNKKGDMLGIEGDRYEYGGGSAYNSRLTRCDFTDAAFWKCSLMNCTIHDVGSSVAPCVFYEENWATNCLVTGCSGLGYGMFFRYLDVPTSSNNEYRGSVGGSMVNCTFADNSVNNDGMFYMHQEKFETNKVDFVNCIFSNNKVKGGAVADLSGARCKSGVTLRNCIYGVSDGTLGWEDKGSNIQCADPKFAKDMKDGLYPYYMPKASSPAVNAGVIADWMASAVDLSGASRVRGESVDIGCYESCVASDGMLIFVR